MFYNEKEVTNTKERIIFHIDVNNAFLSWTAVYLLENGYKKDIREIPSIIGGDEKTRRGIVLAKSPVAKKYKIQTAETIYQAKQKCPTLEVYPPNYKWYSKKSRELMDFLSQYSPNQEQLSIDECFLDMTGMNYIYKDLEKLAHKIKDEVKKKFGYTINIGIGNNKLCAKMASDFEKPDKVHTLLKDEIVTKLWPLDVGDLYMCGKKTKERLNQMKIYTIGDLAKKDLKILEKEFKSHGKYLYEASRGKDYSVVKEQTGKNQSISTTETLPHDYTNSEKLKEVLLKQTEMVTRELRRKELFAKTVGVIFKNSHFINYSAQETLEQASNNTKEILNKVYQIFDENYKNDEIRLIGVRLSNLTEKKQEQISLFDIEQKEEKKDNTLQETMDKINTKFGKSIVKPASLKLVGERKLKK